MGGLSSSRRRQNPAAVLKFLSLKKRDMALRSDRLRWMGCRLECVKYAASSAWRFISSLNSLRLISMRSAVAYSRAMPRSSRTSSTSRRDSTNSTVMLWMMDTNSLSASPNFPSVVVLYAVLSFSSSRGRDETSAGGGVDPGGSSAVHPRPSGKDNAGAPATPVSGTCVASAASMKYCRSGAKCTMPSWRLSNFMALSKSPAAACSPGTADFCVQRREAGTPAVGAMNVSENPSPPPGESGPVSMSGGSSKSSISHPASSSPSSPSSRSSGASPAAARGSSSSSSAPTPPPRSISKSSPHPAPPPSSSPMPYPAAYSPPTSPDSTPSKNPLDTVSSGQLSSRRIGVGGVKSSPCPSTAGTATPDSVSDSSRRAASSSNPCVLAVRYASG
mmetsp:Transcript_25281/g.63300  ORF Transcript_25281/g.63300 Transcript_25281/m.63300 type:complete len:389 (-) Transcript_25281:1710-2876(-)